MNPKQALAEIGEILAHVGDATEPAFVAWAAGFFDGEGCIRIQTTTSRGYRQYQLVCVVAQVGSPEFAPEVLTRLCDTFGGSIHRERARGENWRTPWRWAVVSREAEQFLREVYPHMIGKRAQAEVALRFRESKTRHGARGELAEQFRVELSLLKHGERHFERERKRQERDFALAEGD